MVREADLVREKMRLELALWMAVQTTYDLLHYEACPRDAEFTKPECASCTRSDMAQTDKSTCWCDYYISEAAKEVIPQ